MPLYLRSVTHSLPLVLLNEYYHDDNAFAGLLCLPAEQVRAVSEDLPTVSVVRPAAGLLQRQRRAGGRPEVRKANEQHLQPATIICNMYLCCICTCADPGEL